MISGTFTLTGIVDGESVEYKEFIITPSTISVSPFNVQKTPLSIELVHRVGASTTPHEGFIQVRAKSGDVAIAGTEHSLGMCSQTSYTIAADNMKLAAATSIVVEAFNNVQKEVLLTSVEVPINVYGNADAVYRDFKWSDTPVWTDLPVGTTFRNGDYFVIEKNGQSNIYMWVCRVAGITIKAPFDPTISPEEAGCWQHVTEKTLFATKMLLAKSALLGSAVFNGDWTISQHGVSMGTNPDTGQPYDFHDFDAAMSKFKPNFAIDWLKGKVTGMDMDIKGGNIANFNIRNSILKGESYGKNAVVIHDSVNKTTSVLGSPLGPTASAGMKLGMYSSSNNNAVNIGLKIITTGSQQRQDNTDPCIGDLNLLIDGIGGANILPKATDRWCVPGVLKVIEIELRPAGRVANIVRLREWGHGIRFKNAYTTDCYDGGQKQIKFEYYSDNDLVFVLPVNCSSYDFEGRAHFSFTPMVEDRNVLVDQSQKLRRTSVSWWNYKDEKQVPKYSTYVFVGVPTVEPGYTEYFSKSSMDEVLNSL